MTFIPQKKRDALDALLNQGAPLEGTGSPIVTTPQQGAWVYVTGDLADGFYPCKIQRRRRLPDGSVTWIDFNTDCLVEATSGTLSAGGPYWAIRTGNSESGQPTFTAIKAAGSSEGTCDLWEEVVVSVTCSMGTLNVTTKWVKVCGESDEDPT